MSAADVQGQRPSSGTMTPESRESEARCIPQPHNSCTESGSLLAIRKGEENRGKRGRRQMKFTASRRFGTLKVKARRRGTMARRTTARTGPETSKSSAPGLVKSCQPAGPGHRRDQHHRARHREVCELRTHARHRRALVPVVVQKHPHQTQQTGHDTHSLHPGDLWFTTAHTQPPTARRRAETQEAPANDCTARLQSRAGFRWRDGRAGCVCLGPRLRAPVYSLRGHLFLSSLSNPI